jgi:hypothetical protein
MNHKYSISENSPLFSKVKKSHPFHIHNYLKNQNHPGTKECWEAQLRAMDPNNFIELAKNNYSDKNLI